MFLSESPTFDPSTVPPFRKNWAKAGRKKLLDDGLDGYRDARRKGKAAAQDFADTIFNKFCELYPYDLPMDEEPISDALPPVPDSSLSVFERAKKAAVQQRLLTVRITFSFCLYLCFY